MPWQDLYGHDSIAEQFRRAAQRGRLGGSFLFVGPPGVGKHTFAVKLAKALLCREYGEEELNACGRCPSCEQVEARTHPDLITVAKPADRARFPLELLIGDKDNRMQEGLCRDISLRPFMGGRKIAIIDDADYFNRECANCLLKTLEEPPPKSIMILVGTTPARQLPTIRSRCRVIRFLPLAPESVAKVMLEQGMVDDDDEAMQIALQSEGSLTKGGRTGKRGTPRIPPSAPAASHRIPAKLPGIVDTHPEVRREGRPGSGQTPPASARDRRFRLRILPRPPSSLIRMRSRFRSPPGRCRQPGNAKHEYQSPAHGRPPGTLHRSGDPNRPLRSTGKSGRVVDERFGLNAGWTVLGGTPRFTHASKRTFGVLQHHKQKARVHEERGPSSRKAGAGSTRPVSPFV